MSCKLCIEGGQPSYFGSPRRCAFEIGAFSTDNWQCVTALRIRSLMGENRDWSRDDESFWVRREDQSYGALYVPGGHTDTDPWQFGGFIAGTWYKSRGRTELLVRIEPDGAKLLTLEDAETALEHWQQQANT